MRILVTGASGLLGTALVPQLRRRGHEVVTLSRHGATDEHADLADATATARVLAAHPVGAVVNLAAATNVDECERDPALAFMQNARAVRNIAQWIRTQRPDCHLVQVSTDQLYSGDGPHGEEAVLPINYYAYSKYLGELEAAAAPAAVLRTNLFGKSALPNRPSFSDWIVDSIRAGKTLTLFDDVLFSPLSLETLSALIATTVEQRCIGTFNLGSNSGMSKADFAFALARALDLPTTGLQRTQAAQLKLAARRPSDMRMDCRRFEQAMGLKLPTLNEEIALMRKLYVG